MLPPAGPRREQRDPERRRHIEQGLQPPGYQPGPGPVAEGAPALRFEDFSSDPAVVADLRRLY